MMKWFCKMSVVILAVTMLLTACAENSNLKVPATNESQSVTIGESEIFEIVFEESSALEGERTKAIYTSDGYLVFEDHSLDVFNEVKTQRKIKLDPEALRNVLSLMIGEYQFFELPKHISADDIMDGAIEYITITYQGKTFKVGGSNPGLNEEDAGNRFAQCRSLLRNIEALDNGSRLIENPEVLKEITSLYDELKFLSDLEGETIQVTYDLRALEEDVYLKSHQEAIINIYELNGVDLSVFNYVNDDHKYAEKVYTLTDDRYFISLTENDYMLHELMIVDGTLYELSGEKIMYGKGEDLYGLWNLNRWMYYIDQ